MTSPSLKPVWSNRTFAACLFDFDGVILDSEPLHAEAKRLTLEHFRISYPAGLFSAFRGHTDLDFFNHVASQLTGGQVSAADMGTYKRQEYLRLFEAVPLMPGVVEFVAAARRKYSKLGLATSATGRDFSLAVDKYGIDRWFDVLVTGADTTRHKPHPEPYLKALAALAVHADEALVIEDSPNGITSAKAAGCTVAGLSSTFSAEVLSAAGADLTAPSFIELGLALGFS
jgi:beta-phosphoglucomutase